MIKSVLNSMIGVDFYAILSLGFFMTFFCVMLVWVFLLRKPYLHTMQHMPLDQNSNDEGDTRHVQS